MIFIYGFQSVNCAFFDCAFHFEWRRIRIDSFNERLHLHYLSDGWLYRSWTDVVSLFNFTTNKKNYHWLKFVLVTSLKSQRSLTSLFFLTHHLYFAHVVWNGRAKIIISLRNRFVLKTFMVIMNPVLDWLCQIHRVFLCSLRFRSDFMKVDDKLMSPNLNYGSKLTLQRRSWKETVTKFKKGKLLA